MGKWDKQAELAEMSIKEERKKIFIEEEIKKYLNSYPMMELEAIRVANEKADFQEKLGAFDVKNTVKVEHVHGFILMDLEEFKKLPKGQQNKILKLGEC